MKNEFDDQTEVIIRDGADDLTVMEVLPPFGFKLFLKQLFAATHPFFTFSNALQLYFKAVGQRMRESREFNQTQYAHAPYHVVRRWVLDNLNS